MKRQIVLALSALFLFSAFAEEMKKDGTEPAFAKGLNWYACAAVSGQFHKSGTWIFRENDPDSGIQESVRMPSTHNSWALQFRSLPQMKCKIYAEVRCDSSTPSGNALTLGIYNPELRREVFVKRIAAKEIEGKKYKTVCLGDFSLSGNAMLYFAPVINPSVSNVWIKRFILVETK